MSSLDQSLPGLGNFRLVKPHRQDLLTDLYLSSTTDRLTIRMTHTSAKTIRTSASSQRILPQNMMRISPYPEKIQTLTDTLLKMPVSGLPRALKRMITNLDPLRAHKMKRSRIIKLLTSNVPGHPHNRTGTHIRELPILRKPGERTLTSRVTLELPQSCHSEERSKSRVYKVFFCRMLVLRARND